MVDESMIVKFLAAEAEAHEVALISQWRQADAANEQRFRQLEKLWNSSEGLRNSRSFNTDMAWQKVSARLQPARVTKVRSLRTVWMAAASVLLVFGVSLLLYNVFRQAPMQMAASDGTHTEQIDLSDGSEVLLRSGSLAYPEQFGKGKRRVELKQGTAYFKVSRNPDQAFIIKAGASEITVLGTAFEVSSNGDFTGVRVSSGKVRFTSPAGEKILTAGMSARYNSKRNALEDISAGTGTENSLSYATGLLVFNNRTLAEVTEDLNAHYRERRIILSGNMADCRMTARFENEKLENVLAVIRETMGADVRWDKNSGSYIIEGKGCQP